MSRVRPETEIIAIIISVFACVFIFHYVRAAPGADCEIEGYRQLALANSDLDGVFRERLAW